MTLTGRTRVFVLLGDPVEHSLSPLMQNAAFAVLGIDAAYVPLRCSSDRVEQAMRLVTGAGGGGNVTVPHKLAAASAVDRLEGPMIEACNAFKADDHGALVGTNTDVDAVIETVDGLGARETAWLVIGTGGSAVAVREAARRCGARLAVRSRSPARAREFVASLGSPPPDPRECRLVINATPLGLDAQDPLPITPYETPAVRWALDLAYRPGGTPFVAAYRERGCTAIDGREVLVAQGAAALEWWFPGVAAPREVMRAAVRRALG